MGKSRELLTWKSHEKTDKQKNFHKVNDLLLLAGATDTNTAVVMVLFTYTRRPLLSWYPACSGDWVREISDFKYN